VKRPAKPRPKMRVARKQVTPLPVLADQAHVELADEPDRPGIEAAQQFGPAGSPRSRQTDIERADEREPESIESVRTEALDDLISGFVEPASEDRGDDPPPSLPRDR